jgi:hypothetical protein
MLINPFWYAPKSAPIVVSPGDISGGPFPPPPVTLPAGQAGITQEVSSSNNASRGYLGGVVMIDGRVLLVPNLGGQVEIYDPTTDTADVLAGVTNSRFGGACLLNDGRVYIATAIKTLPSVLYDCKTGVVTEIHVAHASSGCLLLPDGKVFNKPNGETHLWVHDVAANTASTCATALSSQALGYGRASILQDGSVFCAPNKDTKAFLYHPSSNTCELLAENFPSGQNYFIDTVLTVQGKVFCVPSQVNEARIFDPATKGFTKLTVQYTGYLYNGGCLLPDHRLYCSPGQGRQYAIVSADCSTVDGPHRYSQPNQYAYPVMLFDGRILVPSTRAGAFLIVGNRLPTQLPASLILSNRYNRV